MTVENSLRDNKVKLVACVLSVCIILFLYFIFLFYPMVNKCVLLDNKTKIINSEISLLQKNIENGSYVYNDANILEKINAEIDQRFSLSGDEALELIVKKAKEKNLLVESSSTEKSISFLGEKEYVGDKKYFKYKKVFMVLSLKGRFVDLMEYFSYIHSNLDVYADFEKIKIKKESNSEKPVLNIKLDLVVYLYP